MYAINNEKRRDPHPICRRSVEKRFPRTLKRTPPCYPLDTVIILSESMYPSNSYPYQTFDSSWCLL